MNMLSIEKIDKPSIMLKLVKNADPDEIGLCYDQKYLFYVNGEYLGKVYLSDESRWDVQEPKDLDTFVEWIEIRERYRGKGFYRYVLDEISRNKGTIYFESTKDADSIHRHVAEYIGPGPYTKLGMFKYHY